MTLTVIFLGLISHFQLANKTRAVFLATPHHEAIMAIRLSDLKYASTEVEDHVKGFADGKVVVTTDGQRWGRWELAEEHLKFQNLPGGSTSIDSKIPSLSEITDGSDPLVNIKNGVMHSRVSAYVDYTGGTLDSTITCNLQWTLPQPPAQDCLPSATGKLGTATPWVTYTAMLINTTPTIVYEDQSINLNADATVWFGNLSDGDIGEHHKDYLGLFTDGNCVSSIRAYTACPNVSVPAPLGSSEERHYIPRDVGSPECTDTRFP